MSTSGDGCCGVVPVDLAGNSPGARSSGYRTQVRSLARAITVAVPVVLASLILAPVSHADRGALSFSAEQPGDYQADSSANGITPEALPSAVDGRRWPLDVTVSPSWCSANGRYTWSAGSAFLAIEHLGPCSFQLTFPRRGAYRLVLKATVGPDSGTVTQSVVIKGLLIVTIGDSVASGEGVPDIPSGIGVGGAVWQSRQCHRSARAAPSLAARTLQERDPTTPVTFVSVACSGATIGTGLVGSYNGIAQKRGEPPLAPQLDVLRQIEASRPVDALVISIGANDVHFSDVVRACVPALNLTHLLRVRHCFNNPGKIQGTEYSDLGREVARLIGALPDGYDELARRIRGIGIPPRNVYLMQYFSPLVGNGGGLCTRGMLGISAQAISQAQTRILVPLNQAGEEAAKRLNWHYVSGVADQFRGHGYCASGKATWVVKLTRSLFGQHGFTGVLHPNAEGAQQIAVVLASALERGIPSQCGLALGACAPAALPEVSGTVTGILLGGAGLVGLVLSGVFVSRNWSRWRGNASRRRARRGGPPAEASA